MISKSLGSSRRFHAVLTHGGALGEFAQLLYPLVVANADDWGRLAGDAFTIKAVVLPTSPRPEAEFEAALVALERAELLTRYSAGVEAVYLQVTKFDEHQTGLHKRTPSKYPPRQSREVPGSSEKLPPNLTELNLTEFKRTAARSAALRAPARFLFECPHEPHCRTTGQCAALRKKLRANGRAVR
jgi:hypothetical protein